MTIKKIGIVGAGTMGHGIALVAAKTGYEVLLNDIEEDYIKKGIASIEKFIDKSIEKGKMTADDKKKDTVKYQRNNQTRGHERR